MPLFQAAFSSLVETASVNQNFEESKSEKGDAGRKALFTELKPLLEQHN